MCPQQQAFDSFAAPPGGTIYVSHGVSFRTEGSHRVIDVHGVVFAHYEVEDRAAESYAMLTLSESGYATQTEISRAFGYSTRSLRRYQERFEAGGIGALARSSGRPAEARTRSREGRSRDQTILRLKTQGWSNRAIAGKLGVVENAIRKRLRRLGWRADPEPSLPLEPRVIDAVTSAAGMIEKAKEVADRAPVGMLAPQSVANAEEAGLQPVSLDGDPLDRSADRTLAALGLLEDAAPLFAAAENLPMAGVLLAMPALVTSGVLSIARKLYGNIAPAFYGLRTTLVAYVVLALLRIPRAENLKEHVPAELGRIIGLDRILEVKTLRRKLTQLAARKMGQNFGRELAQRRVAERGRMMGFLYIDGHVRAYHGKRRIAKGYDTRIRLAVPATTDYWVNDVKGDPLFVITAEANAGMTRMLEPILKEARKLLGRRRATVVFDRGGWSPKVFVKLLELGFDILTYRKGRVRRVSEKRFVWRRARLDGRRIKYRLFDQPIRLLKGKLRLRQVTRLSEDGQHQTPILTSRWDMRDIVVAYRMFERWRQENFFKYLREEYLLDGLVDYQVEPDDPQRSVPNPARKAVDKEMRKARTEIKKIQERYGATVLEHVYGGTATRRTLNAEEKKIQQDLQQATQRLQKLRAQQKSLPTRVPLSQVRPDEEPVKLSTERKHLTNVLKLVAYQIESDLVSLIRPHYTRADDEGRTLIQTALRCAATLEPSATELRVTLCPLSSAHRTQAVAALCETLNGTETCFPGTELRLRFAVAGTQK